MKNNPETRFQEFDEEWTLTTLREISNKVMEKNTDFSIREVFTNSAEHGVMSQRDFFSHAIANDKNINSYYIIQPNDFVYNPRMSVTAPVGPINRNALGRTGIMSPLYYVFRTHNIDVEYLDSFFKTRIWHQFMWNNGDNGARGDRFSIKNEVFQEMPIPYPYSPEEQHKIAQFFSRLDSLITAEDKKLERLKTIKSASLEKMFPKQGETVPEVRQVSGKISCRCITQRVQSDTQRYRYLYKIPIKESTVWNHKNKQVLLWNRINPVCSIHC